MNAKMKLLSLAVVGLCGFAGSALAVCPAGPDIASGGAWTAKSVVGGIANVVAGGLENPSPSACRLDSAITANLGSAGGFVRDDTPNAEPRYRAQFKINADALTAQNSTQPVRIFAATTATPANGVPEVVKLSIFGNAAGTARVLGVATACASAATHICSTSFALTPTGTNTIEIDWLRGAAGYVKVWVNNGTEASPNVNQPVDNSAWGGVDSAALGLTAGSVNFRTAQLNHAAQFDRFDSRRQTFIGSP